MEPHSKQIIKACRECPFSEDSSSYGEGFHLSCGLTNVKIGIKFKKKATFTSLDTIMEIPEDCPSMLEFMMLKEQENGWREWIHNHSLYLS